MALAREVSKDEIARIQQAVEALQGIPEEGLGPAMSFIKSRLTAGWEHQRALQAKFDAEQANKLLAKK